MIKVYGFDIVPGTTGNDIAYEASLDRAVAEAESHRLILQDDPELAYLLPLPPSDIYEITLRDTTPEILVKALNDPESLAASLTVDRKTVCTVGSQHQQQSA